MLKKLLCATIFTMLISCFCISARALYVSADCAVLLESGSGQVVFSKNPDKKSAMASTTKIMTALLAIERNEPDSVVLMTDEMVRVEGSCMGLKAGDMMTVEDLLHGLMLQSGNDAANALAVHTGKSQSEFVSMMNRRAGELGLANTGFETPSGLDGDGHYSTALDMAKLGVFAMKNKIFAGIVSKKTAQVTFLNSDLKVTYSNHNRLLREYDGTVGIKTGFTKKAGRCLVSAAERDGVLLVAATLDAPDDWNDHKRMFDYGFSLYKSYALDTSLPVESIPLISGEKNSLAVEVIEPLAVALANPDEPAALKKVIELPKFEYAGIKKGQPVGKIRFYLNNEPVASADITAAEDIPEIAVTEPPQKSFFDHIGDFFGWMF